jgi:hypothetical protein
VAEIRTPGVFLFRKTREKTGFSAFIPRVGDITVYIENRLLRAWRREKRRSGSVCNKILCFSVGSRLTEKHARPRPGIEPGERGAVPGFTQEWFNREYMEYMM